MNRLWKDFLKLQHPDSNGIAHDHWQHQHIAVISSLLTKVVGLGEGESVHQLCREFSRSQTGEGEQGGAGQDNPANNQ